MDNGQLIPDVPYSQEAEEATLGAILTKPSQFIEVASFLDPCDFFILRHQHIFEAMARIHERRDQIVYLTLQTELKGMGILDEIGGSPYLTQLLNNTPMSDHADVYAHLVERAAIRRRLLSVADRVKVLALDEEMTTPEVLIEAEKELLGVTLKQTDGQDLPFSQHVSEYFDDLERLMKHSDELLGIPTGLTEIDHMLQGLQKTDLIIIAARPGMGKTSMLISIALKVVRLGLRVGFITLEMGRKQIIQRMVSTETEINLQRLRSGQLAVGDWEKFVAATERMETFQLFLDDRAGLTPIQVKQRIQRWQHQHGLDLVIVDYLQKMSGGRGYGAKDRVQEVSHIARALKDMAKDFNIPMLVAAQLSREVEKRGDKHPILSDLRDSGEIEQEADIVMFLYRDEVYNENTLSPNQCDVIIAKHRNGPTGMVSLYFDRPTTKFHNASKRTIDLNSMNEVDDAG